jgi:hypothetical protein
MQSLYVLGAKIGKDLLNFTFVPKALYLKVWVMVFNATFINITYVVAVSVTVDKYSQWN